MSSTTENSIVKLPIFYFITTLFVLTILISSGDTFNYFIHDYGALKWINLGLNVVLILVLPFYLFRKISDKLATGIVVYLTVFSIFFTNFFFLETGAQYWEQNYLRDIPILFVYMFSMCLTLSVPHLVFLNIVHVLYCIGILVRSDSQYIDENTIIIISSLLGFSYIMNTFLKLLKASVAEKAEIEKKMTEDEESRLIDQLAAKDRELTFSTLMSANNAEASEQLIKSLEILKTNGKEENHSEINRIISSIKFSKKKEIWEEFQMRFQEVHPKFAKSLLEQNPMLTKGDLKMASLLRLDLSSKQIASLTGNTTESVDVTRSRLRKKMQLDSSENVVTVLNRY